MNEYKDRTTGRNILWATHSYESLGEGYQYTDEITVQTAGVIRPRVEKASEEQKKRTKGKAEVFTPSWVCNAQNNLIDEAWFGRKDVFNVAGNKSWTRTEGKIEFPEGKCWQDYVQDTRLEITCGEAPYLVSRYDASTGEYIEVADRIGFLDRKLRVVSENVDDCMDWMNWAVIACMHIYGFEWQGDSLLLARRAVIATVKEHYEAKFGRAAEALLIGGVREVVSWNLWQMDGLKFVVPGTDRYCIIKDWRTGKTGYFKDLIKD